MRRGTRGGLPGRRGGRTLHGSASRCLCGGEIELLASHRSLSARSLSPFRVKRDGLSTASCLLRHPSAGMTSRRSSLRVLNRDCRPSAGEGRGYLVKVPAGIFRLAGALLRAGTWMAGASVRPWSRDAGPPPSPIGAPGFPRAPRGAPLGSRARADSWGPRAAPKPRPGHPGLSGVLRCGRRGSSASSCSAQSSCHVFPPRSLRTGSLEPSS